MNEEKKMEKYLVKNKSRKKSQFIYLKRIVIKCYPLYYKLYNNSNSTLQ